LSQSKHQLTQKTRQSTARQKIFLKEKLKNQNFEILSDSEQIGKVTKTSAEMLLSAPNS